MQNQQHPQQMLGLAEWAWWGILNLAFDHGWTPMGAVWPEGRYDALDDFGWQEEDVPADEWMDELTHAILHPGWVDELLLSSYLPGEQQGDHGAVQLEARRLVLMEDAFNLADALERAFLAYEPLRVPASYYLFESDDLALRLRPSLGALGAALDLCRQGAFMIEPFQRR